MHAIADLQSFAASHIYVFGLKHSYPVCVKEKWAEGTYEREVVSSQFF